MMRPFLAISFVVMTGCGDNLGENLDPTETDLGDTEGVLDDGVVAKLVPQVCAARAWPEAIVEAKDSDIAVAQLETSTAVLAVPRAGGDLRGFLLDGRGLVMGDPAGTKIRTGNFTSVAATHLDGRLVVGLTDGTNVSVTVVRNDLGDYAELTNIAGNFVGDATVMHARGDRVALTGGVAGLVMSRYDEHWAPMGDETVARSVPTGLTSAAYGDDAMVAWSAPDGCHMQRVASNIHSTQDWACEGARIATDYASRGGEMVFERGDGIWLTNIRTSAHNELANERLLRPDAKHPRIAFDGTRYWVSYVNFHGDLVVGYLDEDQTLVSSAIEGTRPINGAYDLAIVNGAPWVYALDAETGFNATRMCLVREGQ